MERFSDIVFNALTEAKVSFAGLVCPRTRGELGVRIPVAADMAPVKACLEGAVAGKVRSRPLGQRRSLLRAAGVPPALVDKHHLVIARLDPDVRIVESCIVRTSFAAMVVDFTVEGKELVGDDW